jgi:hypothetical protein
MAVDAGGIGPAGATNGAIGNRVTAFQTKVPTVPVTVTVTMAGARGCTSPSQICAVSCLGGVIRREHRARLMLRYCRSGLVVVS